MRRTVPVLLATVFGLVLLANFHTSPATQVVSTQGQASAAPPTVGRPAAGASPSGGGGFGSPPPSVAQPSTSTAPTSTTTLPASVRRTVDGPTEENRYGPVQVRVTLAGNQIVDVEALQLPSDRSRSQQISGYAAPTLRLEALQAQSAQIHTVSGASYTSMGYRQSLQAALDQAGHH